MNCRFIYSSYFNLFVIISIITFLLYYGRPLAADTITLNDGTVVVGKVVKDREGILVFTNSYGTFNIKKKDITERFETKSYEEDVEIHKKLGKEVTDETIDKIKKDYIVGEEKKVVMEKEEKLSGALHPGGRISVSGSFNYPFGRIKKVLPYGFSGHLALDQGLDMLIGERNAYMPAARAEAGYVYYKKGDASFRGFFCGAGPLWTYQVMGGENKGDIIFALLPGVSFLDIKKERDTAGDYKAKSNTFTGQALAGFRYFWGGVSLFVQARYIYIYDKDVLFSSVGGEAGAGYGLW